MKRFLLLIAFCVPASAWATCNTTTLVTTADSASVQACVNAATAGQTVTVSPGTVTYTVPVNITKGIRVIGTQATTIIQNNAGTVFQITGTGVAFVRISGFTINAQSDTTQEAIDILGPAFNVRVDHVTFNGGDCAVCTNYLGDNAPGPAYGVVDHCTMTNLGRGYFAQDVRGADSGPTTGGTAWAEFLGHEATYPGSIKMMFYEDDTYTWNRTLSGSAGQGSLYGQYGGKAVYRFNNISNFSPLVDAHGDQNPNGYGTIMYEFYNNTFAEGCSFTGFGCEGKIFYLRGGQHIIHDNTFTGVDIPVVLTVYNSNDLASHRIKNTFYWNNTWNGSSTLSSQVSVETGPLTQNVDYFLRAPTTGDVYAGYTPFTYPHPLTQGIITVGPTDCSAATVNTAIASAASGDTVLLTCTGLITWAATVTIPSTKGITLKVQGGTNTPKGSATFPLIILSEQSPAILADIGPGNSPTRITGFKFSPNAGSASPFIQVDGMGNGSGTGGFRVDNNYFDTISAQFNVAVWACKGSSCPSSGGQLYGLIDNNTFHNIWYRANPSFGPYNIQIWNYWHPTGSNQCWGCDGWTAGDFAFGSESSTFVEDNLFEQTASAPGHMRHYISAELGARYVSRHNVFNNNFTDTNADLHDTHGLCLVNSNGAAGRGGEIYANTITGTAYNRGLQLRGGSWLVYDNVITAGGGNPIELNEYRASTSQSQCSATNNLAPIMPPWPVPSPAAWGANDVWIAAVSDGSHYPLPQQIFNTYSWNNRTPGNTLINPVVPSDLVQTTYIQNNRDYFASAAKPAALSSYTAYTYPHPLQGASGPVASLSTTSIAFGNQALGSSSLTQSVTLSNSGTSTLTITSILLSGINSADFSINSNTCGGSLTPSSSCSVAIAFNPKAVGVRTANLSFITNAGSSPDNIPLSGTGVIVISSQGIGAVSGGGVIKNP